MDTLIKVKPLDKTQSERDEAELLNAQIHSQYATHLEKRPAPRVGKKALSRESVKSAMEAIEEVESGSATPSRAKGKRIMKQEFMKQEHPVRSDNVGEATALRKRILSISLFPNLYNKEMTHKEGGAE